MDCLMILTLEPPRHVDSDTVPGVDHIVKTLQFVVRPVNQTRNMSEIIIEQNNVNDCFHI